MNPNNDKAKCKGQAPDGTLVCGYRDRCAKYVRPAGDSQLWADFWMAGEDCHQYESLSGIAGRSEQTQDIVGKNGNEGLHYD